MRFLFVLTASLVCLGGCGGPANVTYDREHCYLDGKAIAVADVEVEQVRLAERVLHRQPIQTGITIAILLIAGSSYIGRLIALFRARTDEAGPDLAERVRLALDRQRAHPVRYFAILASTFTLLAIGATFYIYLDADKRSTERALQQLQYCHLALKSTEEQSALDDQRKGLDALTATAGSIKSLVDQLPPEEQRKAEVLLGQMRSALENQHSLMARSNAVAQAVQAGSAQIKHDIGSLEAEVLSLRPLPTRLKAIDDTLGHVDKSVGDSRKDVGDLRKDLDALGERFAQIDCGKAKLPSGRTFAEALAALESRSTPTCVCRCEGGASIPRDGGAR